MCNRFSDLTVFQAMLKALLVHKKLIRKTRLQVNFSDYEKYKYEHFPNWLPRLLIFL